MRVLLLMCVILFPTVINAQNTTQNSTGLPEFTWQAYITIGTIIGVFILLSLSILSIPATLISASLFLCLTKIITIENVFYGFGNSGLHTVAMFFVIVSPLSELPVMQWLIKKCLTNSNVYPRFSLLKNLYIINALLICIG